MNAFDKLMAAVSAAIARGRPQTKRQNRKSRPLPAPLPKRKIAKRLAMKARVVSARAGHTSRKAYNPPRAPDVERSELTESFAPGPISAPLYVPPVIATSTPCVVCGQSTLCGCAMVKPPDWVDGRVTERPARPAPVEAPVPSPIPAPVVALSTTARPGRGSCKAVDAATGRQCKLPAHPANPDQHRHERGPFHRLLQPGEVPVLRQALDEASQRAFNAEVYAGASHVRGESVPTSKRADQGELSATIRKHRKSANISESGDAHG